jgi:16S rRNA (guanine527-N7)-methyltransferase
MPRVEVRGDTVDRLGDLPEGVLLTDRARERLERYARLLADRSRRVNLVSRRDTGRILSYHIPDSLAAAPLIPAGSRVCDLGSGAGLPGIPLAIARDDVMVVLVESIGKKARFLEQAVAELGLVNARVRNERAEAIRDERFDFVVCRLLGKLRDVLPDAAHLLAADGRFVFYKIPANDRELDRVGPVLTRLRLALEGIRDVTLRARAAYVRRLVVVGRAR